MQVVLYNGHKMVVVVVMLPKQHTALNQQMMAKATATQNCNKLHQCNPIKRGPRLKLMLPAPVALFLKNVPRFVSDNESAIHRDYRH